MSSPKARILCMDDDADTRELIIYVLEQHNFDVTCAETGAEALELVRTEHFDLLLIDNWMSDISGVEFAAKIREFDLKTPILFYSAAAYDADKEQARLAGAQGYLVKPGEPGELVAEVARLIAESKKSSENGSGI
jgi:two-component system, sensor histidine kinase and response regulator